MCLERGVRLSFNGRFVAFPVRNVAEINGDTSFEEISTPIEDEDIKTIDQK